MWNWTLDHWWIMTLTPYFATNVWLRWKYEQDLKDQDVLDNPSVLWTGRFLFALAGMVAVAGVFSWLVAESIYKGARALTWRRAIILTFLYLGCAAIGFVVDIVSLATTGYHPGNFERIAVSLLILIGANYGAKWLYMEVTLWRSRYQR